MIRSRTELLCQLWDGYEAYYFHLATTRPDGFLYVPHVLWTREFIDRVWAVTQGAIAPFLPVEFHPAKTG